MTRLLTALMLICFLPTGLQAGINPQYDLLKAVQDQDAEEVEKLLRKGTSPDTRLRSSGDPALVLAARTGNRRIMELLLKSGANPDIATRDGKQTAIIIRAMVGDVLAVQLLLNHKADPDGGRKAYGIPLIQAVRGRKYKVARLLVEAGAKTDISDVTGKTALDYASISRSRRMINMLENTKAEN